MTTPIFPQVDPNTGALPGPTEARFLSSTVKGVANGVAALNGSGVPITSQGVPMAVIGTTSGTAADAKVVSDALATKPVIGTTAGTAADAKATTDALALKAAKADVVRSTFMAATPTNAALVAAGLTASPSDPLIIYTLGQ